MKKKLVVFMMLLSGLSFSQSVLSGKVSDKNGTAIAGANVTVDKQGTVTDFDGNYQISVKNGLQKVTFSSVGYNKLVKEVNISGNQSLDVVLNDEEKNLDEVIVVGSRSSARSNTTTALPVDLLKAKDLATTGQISFDKALQYRVPSFNTVQTPVNDATSLLDPYEIRNMGPSRTLILINGKRKNMSSLVYVQTSPGRGETGADISAIPSDAIERVEILRDGAAAQYGSDAIAGVMNIILKNKTDEGSLNLRTGFTQEGDGESFGVSINNGSKVGENGYINYTFDFSKVELANRPGMVSADAEYRYWGGSTAGVNTLQDIKNFLAKHPDAGNINGSPETVAGKFLVNGGKKLSENSEMYYNAAYVYKKVNSFANYRTPYWRSATDFPYLPNLFGNGTLASYQGYVPTFEGGMTDYNATFGYKFDMNGWKTDASLTTGGNIQDYTVSNSHNRSKDGLGNFIYASGTNYTGPLSFNPGGVGFTHYVGNVDVSKSVSDKLTVSFGTEFRTEFFKIEEGDEASYVGLGADSFQGNTPENSGKFNRYNLGFYGDVMLDITDDFLINGTFRHEDYSDFGAANVWKLSSRYKFADDKYTLRTSMSTGFRAPTLHQIYTQKTQSSFAAGGIVLEGIVNNVSSSARRYGVPKLKAEESFNFTLGLGIKPSKNFSATLDYYNIKMTDRIVLGNKIDFGTGDKQQFFINALDSKTSGLDFVLSYRNIKLGAGNLGLNVAGNYSLQNEVDGAIKNIPSVLAVGETVFDETQNALTFTSRPEFKYIIGADYDLNKWSLSFNNTIFGPSKFKNADLYDKKNLSVEFLTKMVSDLGVSYRFNDKVTASLNINNILDVMPEWKLTGSSSTINTPQKLEEQIWDLTFNGRYSNLTYDGSHFSQLGRLYNFSLVYKLQ